MKKVITYGTFDLFHIGHLNLLKRAKALGDYLIVAVSSDDFNLREKGKVCQIKDVDRMEIVKAIRYVDEVIPVSYTHLDVYKRQFYYCIKGTSLENAHEKTLAYQKAMAEMIK